MTDDDRRQLVPEHARAAVDAGAVAADAAPGRG